MSKKGVTLMRKAYFIMALAVLAIALACHVQAATYYIDFNNGNDTNSGTSITSPWKHLPGTLTGTFGSAYVASSFGGGAISTSNKVPAGTIFSIKQGSTYSEAGIILINGDFYRTDYTLSNPVTIQADPLWGSGQVVFDFSNVSLPDGGWGAIHIRDGVGGIRIDGQTTNGIKMTNAMYHAISAYDNTGGSSLVGHQFRYIHFFSNGRSYGNSDASAGQVFILTGDGGYIDHCVIDGNGNYGNGVALGEDGKRVTNFTISNTETMNHKGDDDTGIGFKAQNSIVTWLNCKMHDNGAKGIDAGEQKSADGWPIVYKVINSESWNNGNGSSWGGGINFSMNGNTSSNNTVAKWYIINSIIRDNYFGNNYYASNHELYIIHSLYYANPYNVNVSADGPSTERANPYSKFVAYNSIFAKPTDGGNGNVFPDWAGGSVTMTTWNTDYNSYIQGGTEYFSRWSYWYSGDKMDFAYGPNGPGHASGAWYSYYHNSATPPSNGSTGHFQCDAHSKGTGADDPSLPPWKSEGGRDFHLLAPYRGVNISSTSWYLPEMGKDKDGNPRTNWDIGPYEYVSAGAAPPPPPAAPKNFRIVQ